MIEVWVMGEDALRKTLTAISPGSSGMRTPFICLHQVNNQKQSSLLRVAETHLIRDSQMAFLQKDAPVFLPHTKPKAQTDW